MTKIDQILPNQTTPADKSRSAAKPGQGLSFQELLEKAVNTQGPSEAAAAQQAQSVEAAAPVDPAQAVAGPLQTAALGRAEDLLASLEQYAGALQSGAPLKGMSPLVADIQRQAEDLLQAMDALPAEDELRGLLDQVHAQASAEALKFNRGDFVPA